MLKISVLDPANLNSTKTIKYLSRALLASAVALLLFPPSLSYLAETAAGDLDPTFGMGGKVKTDFFGRSDEARAIAIQSDNKIVAVGSVNEIFSDDLGLARYNPDGTLDPTFGSSGKLSLNLNGSQDGAEDVAIQPDGKIVVAGRDSTPFSDGTGAFVLVRFNPNGSLDPTFGVGGIVRTRFPSSSAAALSIALQPDGKIIAGGGGVLNLEPGGGLFNISELARYNPDGSLDQTFGTGGKVFAGGAGIADLAVQPDGKIVAVAHFFFLALRFNTNGTPDLTFGSGGRVENTDLPIRLISSLGVAIQTDGKIVCGGGVRAPSSSTNDFSLVRLNANGTLDAAFGNGGVAAGDLGSNEGAWDCAIQTNGKIVVAGTSDQRFTVARFNSNGTFDNTFNVVIPDFGCASPGANPVSVAYGVALYPNGKILACGTACSPRDWVLARFEGDPVGPDICIQDESNGNILRLSPTTGDYQFSACGIGFVIGGTGTLTKRGDILTLQAFGSNSRVLARIDGSVNRATASVQVFSPARTFTITDRDTRNNSCSCP